MRLLNKLKLNRRHLLACICSLLLLVGVTSAAVFAIILKAQSATVTVTYTDGRDDVVVFSNVTMAAKEKSKSNCFILHGETFSEVITTLDPYQEGDANRVDEETFYFGDPSDSNTWAYSFTGWHIVSAGDVKIPGKTVFQPGDTIDPTVLEKYALDGTLELEALWGKCYFVCNPYDTMDYTNDGPDGSIKLVEKANPKSSDVNTGNRPASPKATIDGVFASIRNDNGAGTSAATANANPLSYDAFSYVVMLTGRLDYLKDDRYSTTYFGYNMSNRPAEDAVVYTSVTFKSLQKDANLQNDAEQCHDFYYKGRKYGCTIMSNIRVDNVRFRQADAAFWKKQEQDVANTFGTTFDKKLHYEANDNDSSLFYFEVTAREGSTGEKWDKTGSAMYSIDGGKNQTVVLNGGSTSYLSLYWDDNEAEENYAGIERHWYIGREACVYRVLAANTSAHANNVDEDYVPFKIVVTGGAIVSLRVAGAGVNSIATGDRIINVYGDGSESYYDTTLKGERYEEQYRHNPSISWLNGGGNYGRLFGDVTINIDWCTNVREVYGGGYNATATVFGNSTINISNSIIKNNVYGGGEYASLEKVPVQYTHYYDHDGDGAFEGELVDIKELKVYEDYKSRWKKEDEYGAYDEYGTKGLYGGDVTINLTNTTVKQNIYGTGKGSSRTVTLNDRVIKRTEPGAAVQWYDYDNAWKPEHFQKMPAGFPYYDVTKEGRVLVKQTNNFVWTTMDRPILVAYTYSTYAYLSLSTVHNVTINLNGSTVVDGDVYGGGELAKVYENANIYINDSTNVKGNVYGGGKTADMSAKELQATVYTATAYTPPTYTVENNNGVITAHVPDKAVPLDNQWTSEQYTWSGEQKVLDAGGVYIDPNTGIKYLYSASLKEPGVVAGKTSITVNGGTVEKDIYGGGNKGKVTGNTEVFVKNGLVKGSVYGGGFAGEVTNEQGETIEEESGNTTVNITGGTVNGSVYGGGNEGDIVGVVDKIEIDEITTIIRGVGSGNAMVIVTNGTVNGSIYGGGNKGNIIGDNRIIDDDQERGIGNTTVQVTGGTVERQVFGGGFEGTAINTEVQVSGGTVTEAVYGGGNQGNILGNTTITLSGTGVVYGLFGGSRNADIEGTVTVNLSGGQITYKEKEENGNTVTELLADDVDSGDAYGGNNIGGTIKGQITVNATGGTVNWLLGGGNGENATYKGTPQVIINEDAKPNYVVGGGYKATVDGTNVEVKGGTVLYDVYAGGLNADVIHDTSLKISGGTVKRSAYGGGNKGVVNGNTNVVMDGGTVRNIYGGANQADIKGRVSLIINDGEVLPSGKVFGGNNATGSISGDITVTVNGGIISYRVDNENKPIEDSPSGGVYGGGNIAAYTKTPKVIINGGTMYNVYGGGYEGAVDGGNVTINNNNHFNGTRDITNVFAGGHEGDVNGNTILNIHGGRTTNAYGGNRDSGNITGTVDVTMDGGYVAWLYGGGSAAPYDKTPTVTVTGNANVTRVSGGGWKAPVAGTDVNINGGTINHVYAGGDEGDVLKDTKLVIEGSAQTKPHIKTYIYGGGNSGSVHGNVDVTIKNAIIEDGIYNGDPELSRVYGGGNKGYVKGNVSMKILEGVTTSKKVYGGGRNKEVRGNVNLEIAGATLTQDVYGGGYNGNVLGSTHVTIKGGTTITGSVYGGAENATTKSTYVEINDKNSDGVVNIGGSVFGGGQGATATVHESTEVVVDMKYDFTATETPVTVESDDVSSGQITTIITPGVGTYGKIAGNVYGGGDLGRVGSGIIDLALNRATITEKASTKVTIKSGHIGDIKNNLESGSVFGGGNGDPKDKTLYMGSVFGTTKTNIFGGYIEGNVYGGGTQSRLFGKDGEAITAHVVINENGNGSQNSIAIQGSVFGGGDRGSEGTTNASVATTVGNAKVEINGNASGSKIYFMNGGVYGDGNLCMVSGHREIVMTNFKTANSQAGGLKTFYSLQRADKVTLNGSQFVLLGAVDLVEAGDEKLYSINRVNSLDMKSGSTVKLSNTVKYLSAISSDIQTNRNFVSLGNNGTNNYTGHGYNGSSAIEALKDSEINTYRNSSNLKNTICVANGLSLEVKNVDGSYGPVNGLFTLSLLYANPGEGGGFVYADIAKSTGDFICMTTKANSSEYMNVIDTVGGVKSGDKYQYYYWYIDGMLMTYSMNLEAYIGVAETAFSAGTHIPHHPNKQLKYVLQKVDEKTTALSDALKDNTYKLVQTGTNLSDNQIAVELKRGDDSLGFLTYNDSTWGISGKIGYVNTGDIDNNILMTDSLTYDDNLISVVLHKSKAINTEIRGIAFDIAIDLYDDNSQYDGGTNAIVLKTTAAILRLYASQSKYAGDSRLYNGVPTDSTVQLTKGSSYSVEYQTNYLPSNFAAGTFEWQITTKEYTYYHNSSTGEYGTLDESDNVVNKSANFQIGNMTSQSQISASYLPAGTKITLVDMTDEAAPTYYYYICTDKTYTINLNDFVKMGTNTRLEDTEPAFKRQYEEKKNESGLASERLVIVCDFANVQWSQNFNGELHLQHLYNNVDVMDYIREGTDNNYLRSTPKSSQYVVNFTATGMANGDAAFSAVAGSDSKIPNFGSADMSVQWQEATDYINTKLSEGQYSVKVELLDGSGDAKKFPEGMYFQCGDVMMKPDGDNKFVAIEVGEHAVKVGDAMSAEFKVFNPYYDLSKYMGNSPTATFRLSLYNSANAQHLGLGSLELSKEITFTIEDTPTYKLKVTCSGKAISRILEPGNTISPTITTQSKDTTAKVGVQLAKKINGSYAKVSWDTVFTEQVEEIKEGTYNWKTQDSAGKGSYRIIFTYGNRIEYLSFIVK